MRSKNKSLALICLLLSYVTSSKAATVLINPSGNVISTTVGNNLGGANNTGKAATTPTVVQASGNNSAPLGNFPSFVQSSGSGATPGSSRTIETPSGGKIIIETKGPRHI